MVVPGRVGFFTRSLPQNVQGDSGDFGNEPSPKAHPNQEPVLRPGHPVLSPTPRSLQFLSPLLGTAIAVRCGIPLLLPFRRTSLKKSFRISPSPFPGT
jgi:hypothetical protein